MGFPKPYHLIPHTADLGIEIRGKDLPDLFAQAGWSFFDLMLEIHQGGLKHEEEIVVEAPDQEALMVAWLGELLYLFETRHWIFGKFLIRSLTPYSLRATAWGDLYNPEKHHLKTQIKAVTYHQLRIWEAKGLWRARIIFDL